MASLSSKAASVSFGQRIWNALSAWTIRNSGYQRLGLLRDDLYNEDGQPEVTEAIRRLSETEKQLRLYRIARAVDLTTKHAVLPRDQWTKPEEDVQYLRPYLVEVMEENKEKKKWDTQ